jgi:hypothetical protein
MGSTSPTRVFSSSLTSRRFPALRQLTSEDVEVMVIQQKTGTAKSKGGEATGLFDTNTVKPSAARSLETGKPLSARGGAGKPRDEKPKPPFRPSNYMEAREEISLGKERERGYVGIHSPYDMAHRIQLLEREENQKRIIGPKYDPPSGPKAREVLKINYYLNSPDSETLEAERRYIKDKAARNMVEYYRRMHAVMEKKAAAAAST